MSLSGWETHPDVPEWMEAFLDIQEWSGGPPGCSGMVVRTSQMFLNGRKALPNVREPLPNFWE